MITHTPVWRIKSYVTKKGDGETDNLSKVIAINSQS